MKESTTIQEKFGLRVKELRKAKKLSQEKLAYKADIDRTYMTSLENGKRNVSIANIEKVIKALDVSFEEFFNAVQFKVTSKSDR